MDLHDFSGGDMYFNESISSDIRDLLALASNAYARGGAERPLLEARKKAPESLTVLVALYRFYYYQHRYQDALNTAHQSMGVAADRLGFPDNWRQINMSSVGYGVMKSMTTLVRFYLLSLKGAGYMNLRMGNITAGVEMLEKVAALDVKDRLGALDLLNVVEGYQRKVDANFGQLTLVSSG